MTKNENKGLRLSLGAIDGHHTLYVGEREFRIPDFDYHTWGAMARNETLRHGFVIVNGWKDTEHKTTTIVLVDDDGEKALWIETEEEVTLLDRRKYDATSPHPIFEEARAGLIGRNRQKDIRNCYPHYTFTFLKEGKVVHGSVTYHAAHNMRSLQKFLDYLFNSPVELEGKRPTI